MKPRLLYFLHCYYNRAGTEQHVRDLVEGLRDHFSISLVFREQEKLFLLSSDGTRTEYPAEAPVWPVTPYRQPLVEQSLKSILAQFKPNLIHAHHFINWPLNVLDLLTEGGAPTLLTFHDYFAVTPYYTMQGVDSASECFSADYAKRIFRADISEYLGKRRQTIARSLSRITRFITPSAFAARELAKVYPGDYQVIEHGIKEFTPAPRKHDYLTQKGALRFGYIGSLLPQKGWEILVKAFAHIRNRFPQATLDLYGGVFDLPESESQGITFHGVYEQSELASITANIDLAVIPSIFAETFSLTLSELWQARVPTIVSDIGALSERVQNGVNGEKFPAGDATALANLMVRCLESDTWQRWQLPQPRLNPPMIADYLRLYQELLA